MRRHRTVEEWFQAAKAATRERISGDRQRASSELVPLLDHIRQHFFDPTFNVDHLDRALGIRPGQRRRFQQQLGCGLKSYLIRLKRETAEWLLEKTDLPIRQIAGCLNYSQDNNFSRDFRRWTGLSAAQYRLRQRDDPDRDLRSVETRWKATVGYLDAETMRRFVADLEQRFPQPASNDVAQKRAAVVFRGQVEGDEQAKIVWRILQGEPRESWEHLLRREIHFGSPALFELLSRKSCEEGRRDRQRGVELARLALACVEGSEQHLGERFHDLIALAHARLGYAYRLVLDIPAAESAFARATELWEFPSAFVDQRTEAELCLYKGSFRLFQRNYGNALALLNRSVALAEQFDEHRTWTRALLQRSAVHAYKGRIELAVPDLRLVTAFAQRLGDLELRAFGRHNMAKVHVDTGNYERAERALAEGRSFYRARGDKLRSHQLCWIEAQLHVKRGDRGAAERKFRNARAGFLELGEYSYAAEVSLELGAAFGLDRLE